jgi:hypothetical protein
VNADDPMLEAAVTARRPLSSRREVRFHPAFFDLDAAGHDGLFARTWQQRKMAQALDPRGLSSTANAVVARLRR